jgi:hypothetical protein
MNNCRAGDYNGKILASKFEEQTHIRVLSARHNEFSDGTAKNFALALKRNCHLTRLDLSNNLIND